LEEQMPAKAFVVAMAADIARSDYAKPTLIHSRSRERLIACRWGPDGEYLSLATAGTMLDPSGLAAPDAIAPIHSLRRAGLGVRNRIRQHLFAGAPIADFDRACQHVLSGRRYALLQQRETISLVSKTRYSHSCGWLNGREIRKDIPAGTILGRSDGMAHRGDALRLDRRVHLRIDVARK
jgi:hypothetical protein